MERIAGEKESRTISDHSKATAPSAEQGTKEAMQNMVEGDELNSHFASHRTNAQFGLLKSGYCWPSKQLGYHSFFTNLRSGATTALNTVGDLLPIDALVVGVVI